VDDKQKVGKALAEASAAHYNMPTDGVDMKLFQARQEAPSVRQANKMPAYAEPPRGVGKGTPLPVMVGAFGKEAYDFVQQPGPLKESHSALEKLGNVLTGVTIASAYKGFAPGVAAGGVGSAGMFVAEGILDVAAGKNLREKAKGVAEMGLGVAEGLIPAATVPRFVGGMRSGLSLPLWAEGAAAVAEETVQEGKLPRWSGKGLPDARRKENPAVVYMLP